MYCKKCGRKLEDGMRFCDRCGQSVRQNQKNGQEARRREAEGLKEERLNRRQMLREKEQKKEQKKNTSRRSSKKMNILVIVFVILFCILVIAVIAYNVTISKSENAPWRTSDGSVELNATAVPSESPVPTNEAGAAVTAVPTSTAYAITTELNADGYREYRCSGGAVFPYPSNFIQQNTSGGSRLSVYDQSGGASITLTETGPVSGEARDLMSEYAKAQEGDISYSRAGEGWYIVETSNNDLINHRKCIIINNIAIAYDFSYSSLSSSAASYGEQITYIDEHFTP